MRELVYYIAVSLDGYIAGPEGEFDAFTFEGDHMQAINERFADTIPTHIADAIGIVKKDPLFDSVLMGWNTFEVGLNAGITSPYQHLNQIVFSRTRTQADIAGEHPNLALTNERPVDVVRRLKTKPGKSIWLCGGGSLATALTSQIDRIILKRNPVIFGGGVPLFAPGAYLPQRLTEVETTAYNSGVVLSEYVRDPATTTPVR